MGQGVKVQLHHGSTSWAFHTNSSARAYIDGHDRDDVVEARKEYCSIMDDLSPRMITFNRSTPLSTERPIIRVFHDESTFYSNANQSFHWADDHVQALKQKISWTSYFGV